MRPNSSPERERVFYHALHVICEWPASWQMGYCPISKTRNTKNWYCGAKASWTPRFLVLCMERLSFRHTIYIYTYIRCYNRCPPPIICCYIAVDAHWGFLWCCPVWVYCVHKTDDDDVYREIQRERENERKTTIFALGWTSFFHSSSSRVNNLAVQTFL